MFGGSSFAGAVSIVSDAAHAEHGALADLWESGVISAMFDAVRAEGLLAEEAQTLSPDELRELAPQSELSEDLPEEAREQIERSNEEIQQRSAPTEETQ